MSLKKKRKDTSDIARLVKTDSGKYIDVIQALDENGDVILEYGLGKGWEERPIPVWTHEFTETAIGDVIREEDPKLLSREFVKFLDGKSNIGDVGMHTYDHALASHSTESAIIDKKGKLKRISPEEFERQFWKESTKIEDRYPKASVAVREFNSILRRFNQEMRDKNLVEARDLVLEMQMLYDDYRGKIPKGIEKWMRRSIAAAKRRVSEIGGKKYNDFEE